MGRIYENIVETVGRTPLVRLNRVTAGCGATVLLKCEFFNPLGSVKDRIGMSMIDDAEKRGVLTKDTVVYSRRRRAEGFAGDFPDPGGSAGEAGSAQDPGNWRRVCAKKPSSHGREGQRANHRVRAGEQRRFLCDGATPGEGGGVAG